jgi:hypothetical protein
VDYPHIAFASGDGPSFAVDSPALETVASNPKGEAMQATKLNGSAEIRIAEALQKAEVIKQKWSWPVFFEALFAAIAVVTLLWMLAR